VAIATFPLESSIISCISDNIICMLDIFSTLKHSTIVYRKLFCLARIQTTIQRLPGVFPPEWPGHNADHLLPSSVEVKNC
jgi:hypothetical protein